MAGKTKIADPRLQLARKTIEKETELLRNRLQSVLPSGLGPYTISGQAEVGIEATLSLLHYPNLVAPRRLGGETPVVPLLTQNLSSELYWVSVYLFWTESTDPKSRRLIYYTSGLTLFQGRHEDAEKLQLLRAEWPGLRLRPHDGVYVFEAPGAAHPHWQIDALEHRLYLRKNREDEREKIFRELRGGTSSTNLNDLLSVMQSSGESLIDDERNIVWAQMHLAQRALWDRQPLGSDLSDVGSHAVSPEEFSQVGNWLVSTLTYIRQEIERLVR